jgi:hypothetical protein
MSTIKSNILGVTLACFSSLALCRLVAVIFPPANYAWIAEASFGVTTGHPVWKMWQSRVLGPYFIDALTFGSLDYVKAHILFQVITVAIAAFLCWRLGTKFGGNERSALLALTIFVMCFALLLKPPYLYSWDFIDIIVVILFIDFVLSGKSVSWFIGLFAIAILNRESALIIALWLILDPLVRFSYQRRYKLRSGPFDWPRMLAGATCFLAGFLIVEVLNRHLLVEAKETADIYPMVLPQNIDRLKQSLTHFDRYFTIVVPAFLATVIMLGACAVRRDPQRILALYLVVLSYMASLFVLGQLMETRVYLALVPFLMMTVVLLSHSGTEKTPL